MELQFTPTSELLILTRNSLPSKQVWDDIIHGNLRQVESTLMASGVRLQKLHWH